jgi:hypothetical protein
MPIIQRANRQIRPLVDAQCGMSMTTFTAFDHNIW